MDAELIFHPLKGEWVARWTEKGKVQEKVFKNATNVRAHIDAREFFDALKERLKKGAEKVAS